MCAASTRRFNKDAGSLPNVVVLVISDDLPFAQKRFCTTEGLQNVVTLSEMRSREFGATYQARITDGPLAGLLSRAVVVIDENDKVVYTEQVPEIHCALVRLWKCEALDVLADTVKLHVAGQVAREWRAQGPSERAALDRLGVTVRRVDPSQASWPAFCRLRGATCSTRDLGEDESLAVAVTLAQEGKLFPFVTYDRGASDDAAREGVVVLDFLDTLAWLVGCGILSAERADELERFAQVADGWRRPPGYVGSVEQVRAGRQAALVAGVRAWQRRAQG